MTKEPARFPCPHVLLGVRQAVATIGFAFIVQPAEDPPVEPAVFPVCAVCARRGAALFRLLVRGQLPSIPGEDS